MPLYPLNLQLAGRRCLVVGGGQVSERKTLTLLDCGAEVTLVSPEVTPTLDQLAREGRLRLLLRPFESQDVEGAVIVIAATNSRTVNEEVSRTCRERGILINVVDVPDLCDFYVPASVNRGDLLVTIGTSGQSPMLSKKLRKMLDQQFGPEYGPFLEMAGRLRQELKSRVSDRLQRNAAEAEFLASPILSCLAEGKIAEAEDLLDNIISHYCS